MPKMAVVVIFGLGFATILTLIAVPSLYVMLTRLSLWPGIQKPEHGHWVFVAI